MPYPEYLGYTKNEIKDLKDVVNEYGDVDLEGELKWGFQNYNKYNLDSLTVLDEEMLKESKYYKQLDNDVQTRPLNSEDAPYCDLTIRLGKHKIVDIIEAITDCLFVPFKVSLWYISRNVKKFKRPFYMTVSYTNHFSDWNWLLCVRQFPK